MTSLFASTALRQPFPENMATHALRYLLRDSPAESTLRGGLNKLFAAAAPGLPEIVRFDAFPLRENRGIPDLVGYAATEAQPVAIIENKFWARLTDHQPTGYLGSLAAGINLLLFIVPESRRANMRQDLEDCLTNEAGASPARNWTEHATPRLACASLSDGRILAVTDWPTVLQALEEAASNDPRANLAVADIAQLRELCEQMDAQANFLPFSAEQLSDQEVPRRTLMLLRMINPIIQAAQSRRLVEQVGNLTFRVEEVGCYLHMKRKTFWLGVWYEAWARFGRSPLWLAQNLSKPESHTSGVWFRLARDSQGSDAVILCALVDSRGHNGGSDYTDGVG